MNFEVAYEAESYRSRCSEVFCKKVFLEIPQNSQENICARVSFLIKLQTKAEKETLAQVFSCGFFEISKITCFYRTPLVAASEVNYRYVRIIVELRLGLT